MMVDPPEALEKAETPSSDRLFLMYRVRRRTSFDGEQARKVFHAAIVIILL